MVATEKDQVKEQLRASLFLANYARNIAPLVQQETETVRKQLPYKIPRGYKPWGAIAAEVGVAIATLATKFPKTPGDYFYSMLLGLWLATRSPIYAIKRDLLRAFELSDVAPEKGLLADINPPLPTFMLLLPLNALVTPEGDSVNTIAIHLVDKAHPERSIGIRDNTAYEVGMKELPNRHSLLWAAIDSSLIVWHSRSSVTEDGALRNNYERNQGDLETSQEDIAFMKKVDSILAQILLSLTYRPDLLGEEALSAPGKPKGFGAAAPGRSPILRPRWLGEGFKLPARSPAGDKTHSSPTAHWRRGHWKRVPVGPRDQGGRKWTFIQPTFVNG